MTSENPFEDCFFIVEATNYEQHTFWRDHFYHTRENDRKVKNWQEISLGHIYTLKTVKDRPICVCVTYAIIDGLKVAFYDPTSQLVDYKVIEEWVQELTFKTHRYDNGHRWAHCDAWNFHHCLDAIEKFNKDKSK